MAACAHDIVARMDADDIALPHRFEVQVPIVEGGVDIVGSSLLEFGADADDIVGTRVPPVDPDEIVTLRALPPAVQPPDRRLPPPRGRRRPAATGTWR